MSSPHPRLLRLQEVNPAECRSHDDGDPVGIWRARGRIQSRVGPRVARGSSAPSGKNRAPNFDTCRSAQIVSPSRPSTIPAMSCKNDSPSSEGWRRIPYRPAMRFCQVDSRSFLTQVVVPAPTTNTRSRITVSFNVIRAETIVRRVGLESANSNTQDGHTHGRVKPTV